MHARRAALLAVLWLSACGGSGSGPGAPAPDAARSTLLASPASAVADGSAAITLTATALDAAGQPVAGVTATFGATGGATTFTPASAVTGADGTATTQATSTVAGGRSFSVALGGVAVTAHPSATFTPGTATALRLTAQPASGMADAPLAAVTVEAVDTHGNATAMPGPVLVGLASAPTGAVLAGTVRRAAASGQASVTFAGLSVQLAGRYALRGSSGGLQVGGTAFDVTAAPWRWPGAVAYRVELDRFQDGGDGAAPVAGVATTANYQGGDLAGLRSRLGDGHLASLGASVLVVSSPVAGPTGSGMLPDGQLSAGYHGHWPVAFSGVDARFGSLSDLQALVADAHAAGIRVVLEHVPHHLHQDSPIYAQHQDWFWPLLVGGTPCILGAGCAWDTLPDRERGWVADYLPTLDMGVESARAAAVAAAAAWVSSTGADGLLLLHALNTDPRYARDLRAALAPLEASRGEPLLLAGDWFTGDPAALAATVGDGTGYDGQLNWPLRAALVSTLLARSAPTADLLAFLAREAVRPTAPGMVNTLGHTDLPRPIGFAEDTPLWSGPWDAGSSRAWSSQPGWPSGTSAYERLAVAEEVLLALPGLPAIDAGDEIGLPGAGPPDSRRAMVFGGLSAGSAALRARVAAAAAARAAHPALRLGTFSSAGASGDLIAFRMTSAGEEVLVVANRGDAAAALDGLPAEPWLDLLGGAEHSGPSVVVPARTTRWLVRGR